MRKPALPYRTILRAAALSVCCLDSAHAGITINGTRVVYPAEQREVTLSMTNDGKTPRLIEVWVDSGDASERPDTSKAPFLVTPPLARVDPGKGQTLRIMYTGNALPQDRESVFWINVLEIPPKPKAGTGEAENYVQLAVRSRLKLFYRPTNLSGSVDGAVDLLRWRVTREGKAFVATCINDTPYNVSFSDLTFKGSPAEEAVNKGGMCPAKGQATVPVTGQPDTSSRLVITVINDFGGFVQHEIEYVH